MYVYMSMYAHLHIHVYLHTYIFSYIPEYTTERHTNTHAISPSRTHFIQIQTHIYSYTHTSVDVRTHVFKHACIYTGCRQIKVRSVEVWSVGEEADYLTVTFPCSYMQRCHTFCVWHNTFTRMIRLIHMYSMTHSCGQHDSFICVTWLIMLAWPSLAATCSAVIPFAFHMTYSYARHDSIICAPWVIYMWDMTQYLTASRAVTRQRHHTYEWVMSHAKAITVMSFARDMAHPYVWHDPFICAERLIYVYRMTHLYVRNDSFIFVAWLIHLCDITHYLTVTLSRSHMQHSYTLCVWLALLWRVVKTHRMP